MHADAGRRRRGPKGLRRRRVALLLLGALLAAAPAVLIGTRANAADADGTWVTTLPDAGVVRQEVSFTAVKGKLYLTGGRASNAIEIYDPAAGEWSTADATLPKAGGTTNLDHIQSVAVGGKIYYVGGLSSWPSGDVGTVHVYDPVKDEFTAGTPMPAGRQRGAGGVAAYKGKIYYAGGLHDGEARPWFDVYDPVKKTWTQLPDMLTARDHFHAVVKNGVFYAIGGRDQEVSATTDKNESYNLAKHPTTWKTRPALPTARGGFAAAVLGKEILVIGGEGAGTFATVEAFNTETKEWRELEPMPSPRHGIQAAVCNGGVYIAAGGATQGGGTPSKTFDAFTLKRSLPACTPTSPTPRGCTITGTSGRDTLTGTGRRDVICGLGGNDTIRARGGNDVVYGDGGRDVVYSGGGRDNVYGGSGRDVLVGGSGRDHLRGQGGGDTLRARDRSRDVLDGGRGRDRARRDRGLDRTRNIEVFF